MSREEKLEALKAKARAQRAATIDQLDRAKEFVSKHAKTATLPALEARLVVVEKAYKIFEGSQLDLETVGDEEQIMNVRSNFEETYLMVKSSLQVFINDLLPKPTRKNNDSKENNTVKLPKCEITPFDGDRKKWLNFHESFNKLIHDNQNLSDIARFGYLKSLITFPAIRIIDSLELTSENYHEALLLLRERYENKKLICDDHIREIVCLSPIVKASSEGIRGILDTVNSNLRALHSLKRPTEHWDDIIVYLVCSKLDTETHSKWKDEAPSDRMPSFDELKTFLNKRCQTLENQSAHSIKSNSPYIYDNNSNAVRQNRKQNLHRVSLSVQATSCSYCSDRGHPIYKCRKFINLSIAERRSTVSRLSLCSNCLRSDHLLDTCTSRFICLKCKQPHHTLLHDAINMNTNQTNRSFRSSTLQPKNRGSLLYNCSQQQHTPEMFTSEYQNGQKTPHITVDKPEHPGPSTSLPSTHQASLSHNSTKNSYVYLSTALVKVYDKGGIPVIGRALLDSASQAHIITESFASRLGLPRKQIDSSIKGINDTESSSNFSMCMKIHSCTSEFNAVLEAQILPHITSAQPTFKVDTAAWQIPKNLRLADPQFAVPQKIDLLIGAELFITLLAVGQIGLSENLPRLQNTQLGWIIAGKISGFTSQICHSHIATISDEPTLNTLIERFWNIENASRTESNLTQMEIACENHFNENTYRDKSGRFVVSLPLTTSPNVLGNSRIMAMQRFLNLEKRLSKDNSLKQSYDQFLDDYHSLGHMVQVSDSDIPKTHYFIPHHCVFKDANPTTKIRVVFDASAKTDTGKSLNDIMMIGPTIQSDLFSILLRFRTHRFVISADITKMYRQIRLDNSDTHLQYIFWRKLNTEPLNIFRLTTVTYGMAASSYLATKCLNKLAELNSSSFPAASSAIQHDTYVDDLLTGGNTLDEVKHIKKDIVHILKGAGMELRKWCSNDKALLSDVDESDLQPYLCIDNSDYVKTLGLYWLPQGDHFRFKVTEFDPAKPITKRIILSELARIFDPLGYTGPVITYGKLFIQCLWKLKIDWDAALPQILHSRWQLFRGELNQINTILVPRFLQFDQNSEVQIHGFSDASEVAYGASIYLRSMNSDGIISCFLLCSKSRIAPNKRISLPRLELCAAELLVQLQQRSLQCMKFKNPPKLFYWTDSTIVLHWMAAETSNYKTFVANRVSFIQQFSTYSNWNHISSHQNPSDLISRGMLPSALINSQLWFHGPNFLSQPENSWTISNTPFTGDRQMLEVKIIKSSMVAVNQSSDFNNIYKEIKYHNNFRSLLNVISFMLRFRDNSTYNKNNRCLQLELSVEERDRGLHAVIKMIQQDLFAEDYHKLSRGKQISSNSRLKSLAPYLDNNHIIRVGGRLTHSALAYSIKHPILLPSSHPFTLLLLNHLHKKYLHAGPQALLAATRQQFWPLNGRHLVQKVVNQCITCRRVNPRNIVQFMGDLPSSRTTISSPFINTGIDFCGPFYIHYKLRGKRPTKAYLCVFICFSTKAVHFELATELTTAAFIGALKRFFATRGICRHIWSDNATNFIGANNELRQLYELFSSQCHQLQINNLCQEDKITWHFSPPHSPHFGGIYEAAVKSAKHHLRLVMANASLTFEELNTLVKQAEAVLNSRPLCPMSSDPSDLQALTPGHFLIGRPLTSIPEPDIQQLSHVKRWNLIQQLHQHFWARWSSEYLVQLQQRKSWTKPSTKLSRGDLVLLKDDNLPPLKWRMGRILELHPGKDGITRVVILRTQYGEFKRAVTQICPLPNDSSNIERSEPFKVAEYVDAQQ